jgi:competence protein ComFA
MKVSLYAVLLENGLQYEFSMDLRVDCAYWFEERNASAILLFEPSMSVGQACAWKKTLSAVPFRSYDAETMMQHMRKLRRQLLIDEEVLRRIHVREIPVGQWEGYSSEAAAARDTAHDTGVLERLSESLDGRALLEEELMSLLADCGLASIRSSWKSYVQTLYLKGEVEFESGVARTVRRGLFFRAWKPVYRCSRCGSGAERLRWTPCASCGESCAYCEECLTMGRARLCSLLIIGKRQEEETEAGHGHLPKNGADGLNRWGLSPAQREASIEGVRFLLHVQERAKSGPPPCFLIWAVTGAGKTEMIFPLIEAARARGGAVAIATPRKDVVLELLPRLAQAFPEVKLVALYGGSGQRWEAGGITLATTHQLLRFRAKFDLVIIDEVDAFPFHGNPMLEYAAINACKPGGKYILLSATPPPHLKKAANKKAISHVKVPARYHGYPLPVPKFIRIEPLSKLLGPYFARQESMHPPHFQKLPKALYNIMDLSLSRGAQIFVFVPKIKYIAPLIRWLQAAFPAVRIDGTSAEDPDRANKVQAFRRGEIRILMTTTILERGVTVAKSDVIILDADSALFDDAALIQMAGRAGRSASDPRGNVYYAASEKTRAQASAVKYIIAMNRLARKRGYLLHK